MRVILLKDVKSVGKKGDIVEVADGYGRNFLIPRNLGMAASEDTVKVVQERLEQDRRKNEAAHARAEALAKKLEGLTLKFDLPATSSGKLYASLKEEEILAKLKKEEPRLPPETKLLTLDPIKQAGEHELAVGILDGVKTKVKIIINGEKKQ